MSADSDSASSRTEKGGTKKWIQILELAAVDWHAPSRKHGSSLTHHFNLRALRRQQRWNGQWKTTSRNLANMGTRIIWTGKHSTNQIPNTAHNRKQVYYQSPVLIQQSFRVTWIPPIFLMLYRTRKAALLLKFKFINGIHVVLTRLQMLSHLLTAGIWFRFTSPVSAYPNIHLECELSRGAIVSNMKSTSWKLLRQTASKCFVLPLSLSRDEQDDWLDKRWGFLPASTWIQSQQSPVTFRSESCMFLMDRRRRHIRADLFGWARVLKL